MLRAWAAAHIAVSFWKNERTGKYYADWCRYITTCRAVRRRCGVFNASKTEDPAAEWSVKRQVQQNGPPVKAAGWVEYEDQDTSEIARKSALHSLPGQLTSYAR